ncbi:MAG: hypothetical protein LIO68_08545 [Rikenellaceae bacterium]|nr:hypothetical protein [Rikenellaceae bacterium]
MTQTVYLFDSRCNLSGFYFTGPQNDWTDPQNASLWRDGYETLFDPCPAGWRVPGGGDGELSPWRDFGSDDDRYTNGNWNATDSGCNWNPPAVYGTPSVWYPASGWRHFLTGDPGATCRETTIWSAFGGGFLFGTATFLRKNNFSGRAHGFPVRCVRE